MAALSQEGRLEPFLTELARTMSWTSTRRARLRSSRATRLFCSRLRITSATRLSSTEEPAPAGKPPGFPGPFHGGTSFASRHIAKQWAIVDSNHGPPPYQSGA